MVRQIYDNEGIHIVFKWIIVCGFDATLVLLTIYNVPETTLPLLTIMKAAPCGTALTT